MIYEYNKKYMLFIIYFVIFFSIVHFDIMNIKGSGHYRIKI